MKVKVRTEFIEEDNISEVETSGILENNKILKFMDGKTKVRLDLENNLLYRENDEMSFTYKFQENDKTLNDVLVKELCLEVYVSIFTEKIIKSESSYSVCFRLIEEDKRQEYRVFWR